MKIEISYNRKRCACLHQPHTGSAEYRQGSFAEIVYNETANFHGNLRDLRNSIIVSPRSTLRAYVYIHVNVEYQGQRGQSGTPALITPP